MGFCHKNSYKGGNCEMCLEGTEFKIGIPLNVEDGRFYDKSEQP